MTVGVAQRDRDHLEAVAGVDDDRPRRELREIETSDVTWVCESRSAPRCRRASADRSTRRRLDDPEHEAIDERGESPIGTTTRPVLAAQQVIGRGLEVHPCVFRRPVRVRDRQRAGPVACDGRIGDRPASAPTAPSRAASRRSASSRSGGDRRIAGHRIGHRRVGLELQRFERGRLAEHRRLVCGRYRRWAGRAPRRPAPASGCRR